jgi:hypothetical protein
MIQYIYCGVFWALCLHFMYFQCRGCSQALSSLTLSPAVALRA